MMAYMALICILTGLIILMIFGTGFFMEKFSESKYYKKHILAWNDCYCYIKKHGFRMLMQILLGIILIFNTFLMLRGTIHVLKGINLTINNQEFIAIMGKSGSGKTTLLKLLGLLDRPTEGKVFFKGEDSNSLRGDRLAMIRRREIGFIYQDYYLMDSLSVRENIMLPKILDHSPVEESITEAEKLADIMGVRALLDKKIFELSGGEKQRAAICRALMNHSDLILADEPTGNLDSASSETVMEYLQMINKDLKKAVVLVTHDAYVASFCDRVIFVKDGNIEVQLRKKEKQDIFCDKIMKAQKDILKNK